MLLLANLVPACASSSPTFLMMYSAYKLNKQGDYIQPWHTHFPDLEPVCCSMSSFNCCFLTYIQISQEAGQVVWYSHLFKNFPQNPVVVLFICLKIHQAVFHSSCSILYCHSAYFTYMQSTSWEMLGWKKHKLESRLSGEISITSLRWHHPYGRKWRRTKEPLDESERRE